jgi:hypothetical protein
MAYAHIEGAILTDNQIIDFGVPVIEPWTPPTLGEGS